MVLTVVFTYTAIEIVPSNSIDAASYQIRPADKARSKGVVLSRRNAL